MNVRGHESKKHSYRSFRMWWPNHPNDNQGKGSRKGWGKLGRGQVHEAAKCPSLQSREGCGGAGRVLPDRLPESVASSHRLEVKGGAALALPIRPKGGALCQHELLAMIKAHTENVTVSFPISSLFPGGSRMSLSLTRVLDFREHLSFLSIPWKPWKEDETNISPTPSFLSLGFPKPLPDHSSE